MLYFISAVVILVITWFLSEVDEDLCGKFFFIVGGIWAACLIYKYNTDPEWIAERHAKDAAVIAQAEADKQPRVIREVDGCKVYAFKAAERWHYFTRCKDQTTTDTSWEECTGSGKTRRCETKTESVVVAK